MSETVSAYINGKYYPSITRQELLALQSESSPTSGAASFDRRRGYEDHADETVQPYTASGPNTEFFRLYPRQAAKIYQPEVIERLKKQL